MRLDHVLAIASLIAATTAVADSTPAAVPAATPIGIATAAASTPSLDPSCDPRDDDIDTVAFANDGTVFAGLHNCGEIWRFAPGARGNVAPAGVLTTWRTKKFDINVLGTSGSHLLVAGFSSVAVFAENATGDAVALRFIGDGKDDTESKNPLGTSDGQQLGVYMGDDGSILVRHYEPLHGGGGGASLVVQFAPGASGDVPAFRKFAAGPIALGAAGRLYELDGTGNILASGPHLDGPFRRIAHFAAGTENLTSFALDGRGRFIAAGTSTIHVIAGALSGAPRESIIGGPKTTLRSSTTNGRVGILSLGADATDSIRVFECDENDRGRIVTFAPDAAGNVAPASVLAGPLTHLRC